MTFHETVQKAGLGNMQAFDTVNGLFSVVRLMEEGRQVMDLRARLWRGDSRCEDLSFC